MSKKKILVLMSTYNGQDHLSEQIDSILKQETSCDVDILIRDDGSTDGTRLLLEKYNNDYDNIELKLEDNIGCNASFFKLLEYAADHDYYAFCDQDDVWLPDKLQIAYDALSKEDNEKPLMYASSSYLVRNDMKIFGETRKQRRPMTMLNTIIQNICPGHTQVMNQKMLELLKIKIDTNRIYVYDAWATNVANLKGKLLFDNTSHTLYRQYEGNQLGSGAGKFGQLIASVKRGKNGDGYKYRMQVEYFKEVYEKELKEKGFYDDIEYFVNAKTLGKKMLIPFKSGLYRQRKIETMAFYIAVLVGKY
jgi:rhamnosyltransferase